jgi:hypothetical protein
VKHLLTKFPQLHLIIVIQNVAIQLAIGHGIVMEEGPAMS